MEPIVQASSLRTFDTALPFLLKIKQLTMYWTTNYSCRRHPIWRSDGIREQSKMSSRGLKLSTIKRQNFDFLGLSIETYNDHIEGKPVLRDVMSIQEVGRMMAANNEMAIGDVMVAMTRSLIRKLQRITTLIRPDLSKKNDRRAEFIEHKTNLGDD